MSSEESARLTGALVLLEEARLVVEVEDSCLSLCCCSASSGEAVLDAGALAHSSCFFSITSPCILDIWGGFGLGAGLLSPAFKSEMDFGTRTFLLGGTVGDEAASLLPLPVLSSFATSSITSGDGGFTGGLGALNTGRFRTEVEVALGGKWGLLDAGRGGGLLNGGGGWGLLATEGGWGWGLLAGWKGWDLFEIDRGTEAAGSVLLSSAGFFFLERERGGLTGME